VGDYVDLSRGFRELCPVPVPVPVFQFQSLVNCQVQVSTFQCSDWLVRATPSSAGTQARSVLLPLPERARQTGKHPLNPSTPLPHCLVSCTVRSWKHHDRTLGHQSPPPPTDSSTSSPQPHIHRNHGGRRHGRCACAQDEGCQGQCRHRQRRQEALRGQEGESACEVQAGLAGY
jgi:hypothetical protein